MTPGSGRTLVVLLNETRGWPVTAPAFVQNVLEPLAADLALCVSRAEAPEPDPLHARARYVWDWPEPEDWGDAYETMAGHRDWEGLRGLSGQFLAPIPHPRWSGRGSDAIGYFFRRLLAQRLRAEGLEDYYDWLVVTRSDYLWPRPHPSTDLLDPSCLYVLDGESYGGVEDRHHVVPRGLIGSYLEVVAPIFDAPEALRGRLEQELGPRVAELNPERYWAFRLRELGLWDRVRRLPYLPYLVREEGGGTRWAAGQWHPDGGYFVKYPYEFARSRAVQRVIVDASSWQRYFRPVGGAPLRLRLGLQHRLLTARQTAATAYVRQMTRLLRRLGRA